MVISSRDLKGLAKQLMDQGTRTTDQIRQSFGLDAVVEDRIKTVTVKTGLKVRAEVGMMIALGDAFNMTGSSRDICHPETGDHHRMIDNFVDLACAGQPMGDKKALKGRVLGYFQHVTDANGAHGHNMGYYYAQFSQSALDVANAAIDGQKSRDEAYVSLAIFVKELEAMRDYIRDGYTCHVDGQAPDKISLAKARQAEEFTQTAQDLLDTMSNTRSTVAGVAPGGFSDNARTRAANATATFFPGIIANAPKPEEAAKLLRPAKNAPQPETEPVKEEEVVTREAIDTSAQQANLITIQKDNAKLMKEWWTLWKAYGDGSKLVNGESPKTIGDGLNAIDKALKAWANPNKTLNRGSLVTFAKQLEDFAPSLQHLNGASSRMATPERVSLEAITYRFMRIMQLVNDAHRADAIFPPDLITNLTAVPATVATAAEPASETATSSELPAPVSHAATTGVTPRESFTETALTQAAARMRQTRSELDRQSDLLLAHWDKLRELVPKSIDNYRNELKTGISEISTVLNALERPTKELNLIPMKKFLIQLRKITHGIEDAVANQQGTIIRDNTDGFVQASKYIQNIISEVIRVARGADRGQRI